MYRELIAEVDGFDISQFVNEELPIAENEVEICKADDNLLRHWSVWRQYKYKIKDIKNRIVALNQSHEDSHLEGSLTEEQQKEFCQKTALELNVLCEEGMGLATKLDFLGELLQSALEEMISDPEVCFIRLAADNVFVGKKQGELDEGIMELRLLLAMKQLAPLFSNL